METCPVYIHFVVLKESIVYVHIQIPKVPCFVCLSDCYGIGDSLVFLGIFKYLSINYFWVPR